jgi:cyclase
MPGDRPALDRCNLFRWTGPRSSIFALFAAMCMWLCVLVGHAQEQKPTFPLQIENVRGDLYMLSGDGGGDVAVELTNEGVILGDDMFDRNHADILAKVNSISDQPIKYVFNTHYHDDHSGGDAKMLAMAQIIAHQNLRAILAAKKQPYYEDTPGTPIGLPQITFSDEASVHLGGKEVRALYLGRGHTSGDSIIYFPEEKTIQTGDLFLARTGPAAQKLFILLITPMGAASSNGREPWTGYWPLILTG